MRYQETYPVVDDTEDWETIIDTDIGRFGERDQPREYRPKTASPTDSAPHGIAARLRAFFRTQK